MVKSVVIIIVITGTVFFCVLGIWIYFSLFASKRIYVSNDSLPEKYVAIVLGAKVYSNGNPSDMLEDRLLTAFDLYKAGKVKRFLLSGDHGTTSYDEVDGMKNYLTKLGVKKEDIFLDHAGFDTYDSMYRAREIFEVRDALIVTQGYHLPRAVFLARKLGIDAEGVIADRRPYRNSNIFKARELGAQVKSFFELVFRIKPKHLGEQIPITGDSSASFDDK